MRHYEYIFLLEEAHYLWEASLAAEADGDTFTPLETFTDLVDGGKAKARIVRFPQVANPLLVLVLKGVSSGAADDIAKVFFPKTFDKAGATCEGEYVFCSSHIPPKLRPSPQEILTQ